MNYYHARIKSIVTTKILENIKFSNPPSYNAMPLALLESIKVLLNNNQVTFSQPLVLKDGQVFVPYKDIFQSLGSEVVICYLMLTGY